MAQRLLDGEGRCSGSLTAMDGAMAPQWGRQWTAQRLLDGEGRRDSSSLARDGTSVAAMDREHNGNEWRWTAQWRIEGDGGRGATARNGATAMATRRQGTVRW